MLYLSGSVQPMAYASAALLAPTAVSQCSLFWRQFGVHGSSF
jgi:hypothetical protein